jgi:drug/metabolite transporter (DMT)-like permease
MPQRAGRSYWILLLTLTAIWGASYLFIKVAVRDLEPPVLMCARALIAALLLLPYLVWTLGGRAAAPQLRAAWREVVVLGAINAAIPFRLVAWGETHVDSSVAGIAQATVLLPSVPFVLAQLPSQAPGGKAIGSLLALAVVGTALAQLVLFRLLGTAGARRTSLVTYLMPVFALAYGAVLLGEPVTTSAVLGLVLILGGVALGSGVVRHTSRQAAGAPARGR